MSDRTERCATVECKSGTKPGSNSSPLPQAGDEVARRSRDGEGVVVRRYVWKFDCGFGVLCGSNLRLETGRNAPSSGASRHLIQNPHLQ
jgi:hypothetical protein